MISVLRLVLFPWRLLVAYFYRIQDWIGIVASRSLRPSQKPGVRVERIKIPSRDKGRSIAAYKYTPTDVAGDKPLSVHLNWHASGYCEYTLTSVETPRPRSLPLLLPCVAPQVHRT